MNELVNDSWVYPNATEYVGNMEMVENTCYCQYMTRRRRCI